MKKLLVLVVCFLPLLLVSSLSAQHRAQPAEPAATPQAAGTPALPYTPSLDVTAMDRVVDPCVDFYQYSCGGWQKKNPIPPDQTSWGVYGKLYQDNLNFLRGILEQAAAAKSQQDIVTAEIGDFYAACMDEATIEKRGLAAIKPQLDEIAQLKSTRDMAPLVAGLQLTYGRSIIFANGSTQDPDDSESQIAELDQGGLGLPDRDYYTKDDDKSKADRARYLLHVQKVFELLGDSPEVAQKNAATVMSIETALAKASLTRVERRDPYKLKNKMTVADLEKLAPNFGWQVYYKQLQYPHFAIILCRRASSFIASICAEPKRCSPVGSVACNTRTATWVKRWDRRTSARYFRRN